MPFERVYKRDLVFENVAGVGVFSDLAIWYSYTSSI